MATQQTLVEQYSIVNLLQSKIGTPFTASKLEQDLKIQIVKNTQLLQLLHQNDSVLITRTLTPSGEQLTFQYKKKHPFTNITQLINWLKENKKLILTPELEKESYPSVRKDIELLHRERKVFLFKASRKSDEEVIFYNDRHTVFDLSFDVKTQYKNIVDSIPKNIDDLRKELQKEAKLNLASVGYENRPIAISKLQTKEKKNKEKKRPVWKRKENESLAGVELPDDFSANFELFVGNNVKEEVTLPDEGFAVEQKTTPENLVLLIQDFARAFYPDETIVILDSLVKGGPKKDSKLAEELSLSSEQVRAPLYSLNREYFVHTLEVKEDSGKRRAGLWWLEFNDFADVMNHHLWKMRYSLMRDIQTKQNIVMECPRCSTKYMTEDIQKIMATGDMCLKCGNKLQEVDLRKELEQSKQLLVILNKQLEPIQQALDKVYKGIPLTSLTQTKQVAPAPPSTPVTPVAPVTGDLKQPNHKRPGTGAKTKKKTTGTGFLSMDVSTPSTPSTPMIPATPSTPLTPSPPLPTSLPSTPKPVPPVFHPPTPVTAPVKPEVHPALTQAPTPPVKPAVQVAPAPSSVSTPTVPKVVTPPLVQPPPPPVVAKPPEEKRETLVPIKVEKAETPPPTPPPSQPVVSIVPPADNKPSMKIKLKIGGQTHSVTAPSTPSTPSIPPLTPGSPPAVQTPPPPGTSLRLVIKREKKEEEVEPENKEALMHLSDDLELGPITHDDGHYLIPLMGKTVGHKWNPAIQKAHRLLCLMGEMRAYYSQVFDFDITPLSLFVAQTRGFSCDQLVNLLRLMTRSMPRSEKKRLKKMGKKSYFKGRIVLREDGKFWLESESYEIVKSLSKFEIFSRSIFQLSNGMYGMELSPQDCAAVRKYGLANDCPVIDTYKYTEDRTLPDLKIQLKAPENREYQKLASERLFWNGEVHSGLLILPCGAGKTYIGVDICSKLKKSCLILCTSTLAAQQWKDQFIKWCYISPKDISRFTSITKDEWDHKAPIVISTYSMFASTTKKSASSTRMIDNCHKRVWGALILDEVHLAPADTFRKVTTDIKAHVKLGLTATLIREDNLIEDLPYLVGPKLFEVDLLSLRSDGFVATINCTEIKVPMTDEWLRNYRFSLSPEKRRLLFITNPNKVLVAHKLMENHLHAGRKILLFCEDLFGLAWFAKVMKRDYIDGQTPLQDRDRILQTFKRKQGGDFLLLSKVGDIAIDIPEANVLIQVGIVDGSRMQEAQRVGRIQRSVNFKEGWFYSLVSEGTSEEEFAKKRRGFMEEHGYRYVDRSFGDYVSNYQQVQDVSLQEDLLTAIDNELQKRERANSGARSGGSAPANGKGKPGGQKRASDDGGSRQRLQKKVKKNNPIADLIK